MRSTHARLLASLTALALGGCGASAAAPASPSSSTPATSQAAGGTAPGPAAAVDELSAAEHPNGDQFPPAQGRSLRALASLVKPGAQFGAATGTFTPGRQRVAFGLNAGSGQFIYAPTAIYIATSPGAPARGPFLAPADPLTVAPPYRSKQNFGPGDIRAIYATEVPVPHAGTYTVLAITHTRRGLVGAPGEIAVAPSSPIPAVGQRAPAIATDTAATVHGDLALLSTRLPPEQMHSSSLKDVLGQRPVALLFSTPQFCVSRICGPVTDVAVELQHRFANRISFIHEEVYVDNQPSRGVRPQMAAFHLRTEPWLFTINRHGIITARLEGAFGTTELTQALNAALR